MTTICNRQLLQAIRPEIDAALEAVGKKYGVEIKAARGVFDNGSTFSFKLEGNAVGGLTKEGKFLEMAKQAKWLNVPQEWNVGTVVDYCRDEVTIVGMNSSLTKVVGMKTNGKTYLWPLDAFKQFAKVAA